MKARRSDAELTALRHEFSPEVKFLASSADGVFEGVDQTRALLLTKEYLLDVVHATSPVPHTYDYVLHSFGRVEPEKPDAFEPTKALMKRYWLVDDQKAMTTGEPWMLDFVIEEKPGVTWRLSTVGSGTSTGRSCDLEWPASRRHLWCTVFGAMSWQGWCPNSTKVPSSTNWLR